MDTNVNYSIVGIFVIGLVACIVFGIIWLSAGFSSGQTVSYEIYMKESVGGLNIDSTVEFNGVTVGSVKKIEIDSNDPRLVVVLLSVKNTTPITQGTRATLKGKGLTGITYVALEDNGNDLKPLVKLPNHRYPIISTSPSFFWRLDTGMKKLGENLTKVTKCLEALLDDENLHSIKEILIDVRHVTRTLATHTEELSTLIHNSSQASGQFLPVIQNTRDSIRMMNTQILPAMTKVMLNLDVITNNMTAISRELKDNPAVIIRGKTPQPLGPGEK
jgi:phospholipid/cholesterol/gamma-HCH transport system substrate-binding protein